MQCPLVANTNARRSIESYKSAWNGFQIMCKANGVVKAADITNLMSEVKINTTRLEK